LQVRMGQSVIYAKVRLAKEGFSLKAVP